MKVARTEIFAHTISGLLLKRQEMTDEIAVMRERLAVFSNDVESVDRVLEAMGYDGDVVLTPRVPRIVLFYRGELRQYLANQLRENGPQTSRQMALGLIAVEGKDARDRRMVADLVKRMGKTLRLMAQAGTVVRASERVRSEFVWRLAD